MYVQWNEELVLVYKQGKSDLSKLWKLQLAFSHEELREKSVQNEYWS